MADYSTEHAKHATLFLSTVDTITVNRICSHIRVANRAGLGPIYVTTDGSTPTVGGDKCFAVQNNDHRLLPMMNAPDQPAVVKLIAAVAADYSVEIVGSGVLSG